MKIRDGFVSNSSSSSFCIYGAIISCENANELRDKIEDIIPDGGQWYVGKGPYFEDNLRLYVGRHLRSIGDNELGAEFKDTVYKMLEELKQKLGVDHEGTCFIEEGWYNG